MERFRTIMRMTTVRLSLIYLVVFVLFAFVLGVYINRTTERQIQQQTIELIEREMASLAVAYRRGNIGQLARVIDRRSRAPGGNLYLMTDPAGRVIAGNVESLDPGVLDKPGWKKRPFDYIRFGASDDRDESEAIAYVLQLPNGLRLLVGRDLGERGRSRLVIRDATRFAFWTMALMALLTWYFVGRQALKRLDGVSKSTQRILAGDLSERLPENGSGDEFDRLSSNMNALLQKVATLNSGLRQVSDNIAHDLKTPITRLRNRAAAVIAEDPSKEGYREAMEDVIAESDSLIKTFNALLMISRVEAGSRAGDFSDIDIAAIVTDVHELYEPSAEEAGVVLNVAVPANLAARGNRELIGQAVANLLDNAIKYAAEVADPKVQLTVSQHGGEIAIEVSDNGPGIPEDQRENARKRFVRLEESRTKPGSGLGLSLVEAVAKLHSGRLVLSDNNPGLKATMILPKDMAKA